jgi:hypothetical protein
MPCALENTSSKEAPMGLSDCGGEAVLGVADHDIEMGWSGGFGPAGLAPLDLKSC